MPIRRAQQRAATLRVSVDCAAKAIGCLGLADYHLVARNLCKCLQTHMADETRNEFPYAATEAAEMLRNGLHAQKANGLSLRRLASLLGYKQATVLSHMSSGRVPIPIRKAAQIAEVVKLPFQHFLIAAAKQRHQNVREGSQEEGSLTYLATGLNAPSAAHRVNAFAAELAVIAGQSLDELDSETKRVLREVVAQRQPFRRWLSLAELPVVQLIRHARPSFRQEGLNLADCRMIEHILAT